MDISQSPRHHAEVYVLLSEPRRDNSQFVAVRWGRAQGAAQSHSATTNAERPWRASFALERARRPSQRWAATRARPRMAVPARSSTGRAYDRHRPRRQAQVITFASANGIHRQRSSEWELTTALVNDLCHPRKTAKATEALVTRLAPKPYPTGAAAPGIGARPHSSSRKEEQSPAS
jgi:hypothetical protein